MQHPVVSALTAAARPLEELLTGDDHGVSIYVLGVADLGRTPRRPEALATALYKAAKLRLRPRSAPLVGHPWRRRLHELIRSYMPTRPGFGPEESEITLTAEEIEQAISRTDALADTLEAHLGSIRQAHEFDSHGDAYGRTPDALSYAYDLAWNDLLLITDDWGALLHIGVSD
ncbi:hypothetical protein [Thermomonospora cellulosilytica]|uniref:Uncharacterized protein n=1 Tax=Thermomonospora cellulosilytica TaxID=1411118 RepID=A0A7W3MZL3_9ACTN|nr:hypothetical protein [Thermomonospora cellulosilytica]MBA9004810.1 hypothetical protein [Thermomonospora cellulosilytica]